MDLTASQFNKKLDRFISKDPRGGIVDALVVIWNHYAMLYAFPLLKQGSTLSIAAALPLWAEVTRRGSV